MSTAITDYVTDNGVTPVQSGTYTASSAFYTALSPFYIKVLPLTDQWRTNFNAYCGIAVDGNYGITGAAGDDFLVSSYGRAGTVESFTFSATSPEARLEVIRQSSDFNKDLVMWNDSWIRAPRTAAVATAPIPPAP